MVVNIKEQKEQKITKRKIKFKNYKDWLLNNEIILKSKHRFKSEAHNVYTAQINKTAISRKDDKRLKTFDKITTYSYGTNAFETCESEMPSKYKWLNLMIIIK